MLDFYHNVDPDTEADTNADSDVDRSKSAIIADGCYLCIPRSHRETYQI